MLSEKQDCQLRAADKPVFQAFTEAVIGKLKVEGAGEEERKNSKGITLQSVKVRNESQDQGRKPSNKISA